MEIIGLVIIIILLTLGLLLVVRFVVLKPESTIRRTQTESQMAANFLNTLLQTSTGCSKQQVRSLIQNCATRNDAGCLGLDACTYVNRTIALILAQTFDDWGKSYNLTISGTDTNFVGGLTFSRGDCSGEREAKFSPIQAGGRTLIADLYLCR